MPDPKKSDPLDGLWPAAFAGLAAVVLLPFVLVAAVLYFAGVRHLTRAQSLALLGTGVTVAVLRHEQMLVQQGRWLWALVPQLGQGDPWAIPWVGLLCGGTMLAATAAAIAPSGHLPSALAARLGRDKPTGLPPDTQASVLPTIDARQAAKSAGPVNGPLVVEASLHSPKDHAPVFGRRSFPLGVGADGRPVHLSESEVAMHGLVFGSTGSGKTETIKSFAGGLMDLGWNCLILDLKEDVAPGGLREWCSTYAATHAMPYQELCLGDEEPRYWFNPLEGMNADEAADTILSTQVFPDAFWEAINKKTLRQVTSLMHDAHAVAPQMFDIPSPKDIGELLEAPDIVAASKSRRAVVLSSREDRTASDYSALATPSKDERSAAVGFGARLTGVYNSIAGRRVLVGGPGKRLLDPTAPGLVYIGASSSRMPELAKMVSSSVLRRLCVLAGQRMRPDVHKTKPAPTVVIIDEANFVDRLSVLELLSRARSAGIAVFLATQGPTDYAMGDSSAPGFQQLAQNANVSIIMSQGELENAEICADYIGKAERSMTSQSYRDGELVDAGSLRQTRDHIVSADQLRTMGIGEAIVRVGKPENRVSWLVVSQRDPSVRARV